MAWRVCRILDFKKDCTSIHSNEEMAKLDTGRHLAALASKFHEDLPRYAGAWHYPRAYPGFVEDAAQMLETVGTLLEDQEVWGAYDEWHRFMNRWERILHLPLWAQIGTVIVTGPGPTIESLYGPMESMATHLQDKEVVDLQWQLMKTLHQFWRIVAMEVREAMTKAGLSAPSIDEILGTVRQIASQTAVDVRDDLDHWAALVRAHALRHFGVSE